MTVAELTKRVEALEREVARMKQQSTEGDTRPWWQKVRGIYKDDSVMQEIFELGREYRESLRPKPRKKRGRESS